MQLQHDDWLQENGSRASGAFCKLNGLLLPPVTGLSQTWRNSSPSRTRCTQTTVLTPFKQRPPPPLPQFVEDLSSELSAMKLALRSRCRAVVAEYWHMLEQRQAVAAAWVDGGAATAATGRLAAAAGEPS